LSVTKISLQNGIQEACESWFLALENPAEERVFRHKRAAERSFMQTTKVFFDRTAGMSYYFRNTAKINHIHRSSKPKRNARRRKPKYKQTITKRNDTFTKNQKEKERTQLRLAHALIK